MKNVFLLLFLLELSHAAGQTYSVRLPDIFVEQSIPMIIRKPIGKVRFTNTMSGNGYVQALIQEALDQIENKEWNEAVGYLKKAASLEPDFWVSYYCLGAVSENQQRYFDAIDYYEQSVRLAPFEADCHLALATVLQQIGFYSRAMYEYDKALQFDPKLVEAYYNEGSVSLSRGEGRRALRFYEQCTQLDPSLPDAYCAQAVTNYRMRKDTTEALRLFRKSIEADSTYSPAYFWRGNVMRNTDTVQWLADWDTALRLDPTSRFLHVVRGLQMMTLGRYDEAFVELGKSFDGVDMNKYVGAHTTLDKQIDLQLMAKYLLRKRSEFTRDQYVNLEQAYCRLVIGRLKNALGDIRKYTGQPSSAVYELKAMIFEKSMRHDSAYIYYNLAIQLDKDNFEALKKRGMYKAALSDFKGAYADFNEMVRIDPDSYFIYRLRGIIKYYQGENVGAVIDFSEYLKRDPTDIEILTFRALARNKIHDYEGSNEDNERVLSIQPLAYSTYLAISRNYLAAHDTLDGIAYVKKYIKAVPNGFQREYIQGHEELAKIYINKNDWYNSDKQIDSIKMVLWSPNPNNRKEYFIVHNLRGLMGYRRHDYPEAIRHFSIAADKDPANFEVRYLLARSYELNGQKRKALEAYKEIAAYADSETQYKRLLQETSK